MLCVDELRAVRGQVRRSRGTCTARSPPSHLSRPSVTPRPGGVLYGRHGLARTHLPDFRLSEDLDLLVASRPDAAVQLERVVTRRLRREFGAVAWTPPLSQTAENAPMLLHTEDGLTLRVQIGELDSERRRWPSEVRDLVVRYSGVPQVRWQCRRDPHSWP
jgi:hypothetical protein